MGEEISPHDVMLVDISALDLTHSYKVIGQEGPVIVSDSSYFVQACVCIKCELFALKLQGLCIVSHHELEGFLFVR